MLILFLKKYKGGLLSTCLSLCFLLSFYSTVLFSPNKYLFTGGGDGLLTYYSLNYHVKHDDSYVHFNGLNYPFGDLYNFTDGQPLFANTLKLISSAIPSASNYLVGILNLLILSSFILTAYFLYKVLREYKLNWWFAALFGFLISFLAPQSYRMVSHLSLSYSFFIPLVWFLLLKYKDLQNRKGTIIISFINLLLYFIHPYLGMISTFFITVFILLYSNRSLLTIKNTIPFFVRSFLGILLFFLFLKVFGDGKERPVHFFELYTYNTDLASILLPNNGYLSKVLLDMFKVENQLWEGWAFVGFSSLIILILSIIRIIHKLQKKSIRSLFKKDYTIIIVLAFITLLIAFAVPYKLGLYHLLDLFPKLAQIRVLARFNWLFFFLVNVLTAVYIYKVVRKYFIEKKLVTSIAVILVFSCLYIFDGYGMHRQISEQTSTTLNQFYKQDESNNEITQLYNLVKDQNYSSILALPFYHHSDRLFHSSTNEIFKGSKYLSYYTGKPLFNSSMTRTPDEYIETIIDLFGTHLRESTLKKHIKNENVLILRQKIWLKPEESQVISVSEKIGETENFELYIANSDQLLYNNRDREYAKFYEIKDQLINLNGFYVSDSSDIVFYDNYENDKGNSKHCFSGLKGLMAKHLDYTVLFESATETLTPGVDYEVSYWYYSKIGESFNIMNVVEEQNPQGNSWSYIFDTNKSYDFKGDWTYCSFVFQQKLIGSKCKYFLKGHIFENPDLLLDQVMVKKKYKDVYHFENGILYKNNYPLGKEK